MTYSTQSYHLILGGILQTYCGEMSGKNVKIIGYANLTRSNYKAHFKTPNSLPNTC